MSRPIMLTLTGPSCAGKSFLLAHLLSQYPTVFSSLITYTTREPREGEVDGFEYNFISKDEFERRYENGELCQAVDFYGTLYGTPTVNLTSAFNSGMCPVRIVEPTGVGQFEHVCADLGASVFSVFVNSSPEVVMGRWLYRFLLDTGECDTDEGEGVRSKYAKRMAKCFLGEFDWVDARPYNYYLDCEKQDFNSAAYSLSRIATGKVNLQMATRLSPYPHKDAA